MSFYIGDRVKIISADFPNQTGKVLRVHAIGFGFDYTVQLENHEFLILGFQGRELEPLQTGLDVMLGMVE